MPDSFDKNRDTRSEYLIFTAFLRQKWLGECATMLHYMYIACLVLSRRIRRIKASISCFMCVRVEQLGFYWTHFREISNLRIFIIPVERIQIWLPYNLTRMMGTLHEDLFAFVIISPWILLRMRNVSDRCCILYWIIPPPPPPPKIMLFMGQCGKIWWSQTGHRLQHSAVHAICMPVK
jgi:hypothetical protein